MAATVRVNWSWWTTVVRTRPFDVVVDEEVVDQLPSHESVEIKVEPGRHALQVRAGRRCSRRCAFEVDDGEVVAFSARPLYSLWPIFLVSFAVPSMAIALKRKPA